MDATEFLCSGCGNHRVCDQTFICAQSQALLSRCIGIVEWKGHGELLMGGVIALHCGREILQQLNICDLDMDLLSMVRDRDYGCMYIPLV